MNPVEKAVDKAWNEAILLAIKIAERPRVQDAMNGDISVSTDGLEIAAELKDLIRPIQ